MENVGGCPAEEVLSSLRAVMPDRFWSAFRFDAADFGGVLRFCVFFLGPQRCRLVCHHASIVRALASEPRCAPPRP